MANIYKSVNISGGITGTSSTTYIQLFDAAGSWGIPTAGEYMITILESTHGAGLNPIVQVFEKLGADYSEVIMNSISVNASGDVTIGVTENLDTRFEGRVIIK